MPHAYEMVVVLNEDECTVFCLKTYRDGSYDKIGSDATRENEINIKNLLQIFSLFLTQPYMGHTGYSTTENVNNIKIVHLHWGLQLIFDESQKEGNNEIWIDVYPLTRFLAKHTQAAVKVEGTKEWVRTADIVDPAVEEYEALAPDGVQVPVKDDSLENSRTESQEVEQRLE